MSSLKDLASLIMVPSLYKDGELHTVKPLADEDVILHPDATGNHDGNDGTTDREASNFTFSRGSNLAATRVDVNGLIEKGRENLLVQSNNLTTTWGATAGTMTGGQADKDGGTDAWKFEATGSGQSRFNQTISVSGVNTVSMYAKAGTADFLCLYIIGSGDPRAFFNLSTGAVGSTGSNIDANIEDVGNGWYRCSLTFNRTSSTLWCFVGNTDANFNSAIGDNIYIQDAQLEAGLVATDYIETGASTAQAGILEDMPRLDYSGGATCPSLLLEPQRTNLIPHSENFNDWVKQSGVSVVQNTTETLSPEGKYNAAKITGNGTLGVLKSSLGSAATNTKSVYLKGVSGGESVVLKDPNQTIGTTTCNLTTEWQRFDLTDTQTGLYGIWIDDIPSGGIYAWGAQLEAGSYPTSYIPTYGSSVTRSKDLPYKTGLSNVIGQTQGTIFYDWIMNHESPNTSEDLYTLTLTDGSNSNLIAINNYNNTLVVIIKATTNQFIDNSYTGGADGARIKLALAYANNDVALYINGSLIATSSSVTIPALNEIRLNGYWNSVLNDNTSVNQLAVFQTRLTNAELAALTTL